MVLISESFRARAMRCEKSEGTEGEDCGTLKERNSVEVEGVLCQR
jgi:hypothetical protein